MKEADALKERIQQIEHAQAVTFGSMKSMPPDELSTHMMGIVQAGWALPFDLRCPYLERRGQDLWDNLRECTKKRW